MFKIEEETDIHSRHPAGPLQLQVAQNIYCELYWTHNMLQQLLKGRNEHCCQIVSNLSGQISRKI
jgi:hypothetical protein